MIILVNFNSYLGGGETLAVRFSDYLYKNNMSFKILCLNDSYISKDLRRYGIPDELIADIDLDPNYYYLTDKERKVFLTKISAIIPNDSRVNVITFCSRDLFTFVDVTKKRSNIVLTHLILHDQDNLYVCQSLLDKVKLKFFHVQSFSNKKQITYNSHLFNLLSSSNCTIPQCDLQVTLWRDVYGIKLDFRNVVPLPVCDFSLFNPEFRIINNKKIIWVGRVVDFKIPALCSMISFVNRHPDYSLTIVGDGDMKSVKEFISSRSFTTSNISFVGEVDYAQLPAIIKSHDIGYAMGTSIIEIGKWGIPVIMALGAPHKVFFKRDICGGLYTNVAKGNVGENLYCGQSEDEQSTIDDAIIYIEKNYEASARDCYNCIRSMYDINTNIENYLGIVRRSKIIDFSHINIPKSSWLRRILFRGLIN